MENPEETKTVTRSDLETAFNSAPICWSWNPAPYQPGRGDGKAPKELNFSVDKNSNTLVHKKFPFAEAVRFVVPMNVCSGYTYWELAPLVAYSAGNACHVSPLDELPATGGKTRASVTTWKTVTLETARQGVRAYNDLKWIENGAIRCNADIDREARDMFAERLGRTEHKILQQVQFIGRDYGGVAGFPSAVGVAPDIAADIYKSRPEYEQAAYSARPLLYEIPSREAIETLYRPFVKPIHGKSNWLVWATKFWHFLNPDAFPIEDSRVHIFFVINQPNSVDKYLSFCNRFRGFALSHQEWLPELRQVDGGTAWCDNKLWDKVCYGLGDLDSP